MLKLLRRGAVAGLLAAGAYAILRFLASRTPDTAGMTFEATPFPGPPRPVPRRETPAPATTVAPAEPDGGATPTSDLPWIEPVDGACPQSHPVKAKMTSGIFHVPGAGSYDRTRAERCYLDADAATADGLRPPKR